MVNVVQSLFYGILPFVSLVGAILCYRALHFCEFMNTLCSCTLSGRFRSGGHADIRNSMWSNDKTHLNRQARHVVVLKMGFPWVIRGLWAGALFCGMPQNISAGAVNSAWIFPPISLLPAGSLRRYRAAPVFEHMVRMVTCQWASPDRGQGQLADFRISMCSSWGLAFYTMTTNS